MVALTEELEEVLLQKTGKEIQKVGVLKDEFRLFKPILPGDTLSYEFKMMRGSGGHLTDTISEIVKGTVKQ